MKSIDIYKDAVMRRVEEKQRERRKARKRLLAACVPLCLCIGIAAALVPPMFSVGSDHEPESSDGSLSASADLKATVSYGTATWTLTDSAQADQLYSSLQALCEPTDTTIADLTSDQIFQGGSLGVPETAGDPTDGCDEETVENHITPCYRIAFSGSDEAHFLLEGMCLTDLASGETQLLTDEQLSELMDLLEP